MKGDIPAVAFKLLTQLPVRTYYRELGPVRLDRTDYMRWYMKNRRKPKKR